MNVIPPQVHHDTLGYTVSDRAPIDVFVPPPPMGGKIWLLQSKGLFVLERGPGTLRTLAVTHGGAGALEAIDGIPNGEGFFPEEGMPEPEPPPPPHISGGGYDELLALYIERRKAFDTRNGRPIYQAPSAVMGSWMLDGGFIHGLCIRTLSGSKPTAAIASIVWVAMRRAAPAP